MYLELISLVYTALPNQGNITRGINIRIHRDITGEMWLGIGQTLTFNVVQTMGAGQDRFASLFVCEFKYCFKTFVISGTFLSIADYHLFINCLLGGLIVFHHYCTLPQGENYNKNTKKTK